MVFFCLLAFPTLNLSHFCQPSAVAFLSSEARSNKSSHDLQRKFRARYSRSKTKDVAVIMLTRLMT
jgi:hypothetical protein